MTLVQCTWTKTREFSYPLLFLFYNGIFKVLATLYNENLINNNFLATSENNYID